MKKDKAIQVVKAQYENVATALYLVTNHLKDNEPLKTKVRQISHDILEQMIHMSDMSHVHVEAYTQHLMSLLKIASASGLIAEQNATILAGALQKTLKDMQEYMRSHTNMSIRLSDLLSIEDSQAEEQNQLETNEVVDGDLVDPSAYNHSDNQQTSQTDIRQVAADKYPATKPVNQPDEVFTPKRQGPDQINQIKNQAANATNNLEQFSGQKMSFNGVASMRQAFKDINQKADISGSVKRDMPKEASGTAQPASQLSDRQMVIIREIRNRGQLTIRDLADKIKGCSEKTIQRELLALVGAGVLKKEGERRWSKYSISGLN